MTTKNKKRDDQTWAEAVQEREAKVQIQQEEFALEAKRKIAGADAKGDQESGGTTGSPATQNQTRARTPAQASKENPFCWLHALLASRKMSKHSPCVGDVRATLAAAIVAPDLTKAELSRDVPSREVAAVRFQSLSCGAQHVIAVANKVRRTLVTARGRRCPWRRCANPCDCVLRCCRAHQSPNASPK